MEVLLARENLLHSATPMAAQRRKAVLRQMTCHELPHILCNPVGAAVVGSYE
jgi:hypothetical protein